MHFVFRAIFIVTLACLAIVIFAFTAGQIIPIEFNDLDDRNLFYDIGFHAIPIGILLTLTGTIKGSDGVRNITLKVVLTVFASGLSIAVLMAYMFTLGFGSWVDLNTRFRAKDDRRIRIVEQLYDIGAFGYGGRRVVKTVPVTPWFNYIGEVDSAEVDKSQWIPVYEDGDVKY